MSDGAVTFLISRLAVASVEFLILGFLVAGLLALLPNIGPRWRRRIWFLILCKPFVTMATGSFNGLVPLAPALRGSLLGDVLFPNLGGETVLNQGGMTFVWLQAVAYTWLGVSAYLLVRVWLRAAASRQAAEDHLAKGYMLKPTTLRRLDPDLKVPPDAKIIITPEDAGPATLGVFRPAILIPESLLPWVIRHRDPSAQERARFSQVLRHELAHVANRDDLVTLATMIMLSFFWFHPVAHWAYRRVRMNNELCCDEDVVQSGVKPTDYVDTLMSIVAGSFSRRGFAMHILGDSSPAGVLRRRLAYVLRERALGESRPIWAYVACLLVLGAMPRFLGHGQLVEVLMRTGDRMFVTRAELHDLGPELVERVLTPGVVDESWFRATTVYVDAGLPDYHRATVELTAPGEMFPQSPDSIASAPGVNLPTDATLLADVNAAAADAPVDADAEAAASAPKRKSRGPSWGDGNSDGGASPSKPILPPPSNRR